MKTTLIFVFGIIVIMLFSCKTEEIILHGEIRGLVTDTTTSQPIQAAKVELNPINDTTSTGTDGKYQFISLTPADYIVEVSKAPYATTEKAVKVASAKTIETDFALRKIPYPIFSDKHLDFGFDSTSKSFTITNIETEKLKYSLYPSQDWITVSPDIGEAINETNSIKVTINRNGLTDKKHIEFIKVDSHIGLDEIIDTVYVLVNGVMDKDFNYYNVITIGTQTWMQENLNVGKEISVKSAQTDNGIIEKWCADCKTYGGLYTWEKAMNYSPFDTAEIGTTQGICPTGWHVPTHFEWKILQAFAGGSTEGGGNLKETGTLHWQTPNSGATNETGFTALPGGNTDYVNGDQTNPGNNELLLVGEWALFWSAGIDLNGAWFLVFDDTIFISTLGRCDLCGKSVRCIKDPPKK